MGEEDLKADVKRWSNAALKAKMDLHDLSEDLPLGWEKIPETARIAHEAYGKLESAKSALKTFAEEKGVPA